MNKCIDCNIKLKGHNNPIRCKSCSKKGNNHPLFGLIGKDSPRWTGGKPCCKDCGKQLTHYDRTRCRRCASIVRGKELAKSGRLKGENHPNYIDGRSSIEYPPEFNSKLKEKIHERDNYECQNCGMTDEEHIIVYGRHIEVHHIDYDRGHCKNNNLITLCKQCNLRANSNRKYWEKIYSDKICKINMEQK